MGGKADELAHCTRCGEGLSVKMPISIKLMAALGKAFTDLHAECKPGKYAEPPVVMPQQWFTGRDTGTSSLTIYGVMMHTTIQRCDIPYDPADFGRCYRLLKLFPEWRERLWEVTESHPEWKPFVDAWDAMETLYEAEFPSGVAPKLYDLMQTLVMESRKIKK
jgi:hypothetical protein